MYRALQYCLLSWYSTQYHITYCGTCLLFCDTVASTSIVLYDYTYEHNNTSTGHYTCGNQNSVPEWLYFVIQTTITKHHYFHVKINFTLTWSLTIMISKDQSHSFKFNPTKVNLKMWWHHRLSNVITLFKCGLSKITTPTSDSPFHFHYHFIPILTIVILVYFISLLPPFSSTCPCEFFLRVLIRCLFGHFHVDFGTSFTMTMACAFYLAPPYAE